MTGAEILVIRTELGLTQLQLAQLLGVHPLTISKWERGLLVPTPHQQALLQSFRSAKKTQTNIGEVAANLLLTAGVVVALYAILRAAMRDE